MHICTWGCVFKKKKMGCGALYEKDNFFGGTHSEDPLRETLRALLRRLDCEVGLRWKFIRMVSSGGHRYLQ